MIKAIEVRNPKKTKKEASKEIKKCGRPLRSKNKNKDETFLVSI